MEDEDVAGPILDSEVQVRKEEVATDELSEDGHSGPAVPRVSIVKMGGNLAVHDKTVGEEEEVRGALK